MKQLNDQEINPKPEAPEEFSKYLLTSIPFIIIIILVLIVIIRKYNISKKEQLDE